MLDDLEATFSTMRRLKEWTAKSGATKQQRFTAKSVCVDHERHN